MSGHMPPFACGRCMACETSNSQACESPRGGCRCEECRPGQVDEANARLIAAAPALLAALEAAWEDSYKEDSRYVLCLKCDTSNGHAPNCVVLKVRSALAAARGVR